MARTATITKADVFDAAEKLKSAGKPVTQVSVREILGGGSFSTIGPLVREWEAAQVDSQEAREILIPDAISLMFSEVVGRLWKTATNEAALGVEAARRELEDLRRDAASEVKEAQEAIGVVEAERDAAVVSIATLTTDLAASQAQIARLQADLLSQSEARARAEAQAEAAAERAARSDADRAAAILDRSQLQDQLKTMAEVSSGHREEIATLKAELSGLSAQLETSRKAAADADDRAKKAETRAENAEARAQVLQDQLNSISADLTTVQVELTRVTGALEKEVSDHGTTKQKLHDRLEIVSVERDNLQATIAKIQDQEKV